MVFFLKSINCIELFIISILDFFYGCFLFLSFLLCYGGFLGKSPLQAIMLGSLLFFHSLIYLCRLCCWCDSLYVSFLCLSLLVFLLNNRMLFWTNDTFMVVLFPHLPPSQSLHVKLIWQPFHFIVFVISFKSRQCIVRHSTNISPIAPSCLWWIASCEMVTLTQQMSSQKLNYSCDSFQMLWKILRK